MSPVVKPNRSNFITVPELLSFQLENNPTHPAFVFAHESEKETQMTKVTFLEYVRAAHRAAHLVRPNRLGPDRAVVGLVALLDNHVYQTVAAGIMQAGLVPLLISPRLTPAAVLNLLKLSGAHRLLITGTTLRDLLRGIKETLSSDSELPYEVTFEEAPSLEQLYPKLGAEKAEDAFGQEYPWISEHSKPQQTAIYLHSSGSTGLPKAIPVTHGTILYSYLSVLTAYSTYKDSNPPLQIAGMALPPFHVMAFYTQFICPLYASITIALFPPKVTKPDALPMLATPEDTIKHIELTRSNAVVLVPTFLQIYSKEERHVDILRGLEHVGYAGGPLAPATGDYLVACGVRLKQVYGLTEVGLPIKMNLEEGFEDWAWLHFEEGDGDDQSYIRWAPLGDGTFELHILTTEKWRPAVENLEDVPGYATSDIFIPHPTNPGLWTIVGRTDDVIIHSSGEKTTALSIEHIVIQSSLAQGVVVFGRQRDQAGILIEPKPEYQIDTNDEVAVSRFRNKIWPIVEQANEISPAYSRIYKEMILITSADKPLPRAAKGTVMRKAAYNLYEKEINQIYEAVELNAGSGSVAPPSTWELQGLRNWIMTQVVELCGNRLELLDDLFEHGFDSLSATVLRLRISGVLRTSEDVLKRASAQRIDQTTIYKNPTVDSLAKFIVALISNSEEDTDPTIAISRMIEKYSQGLDVPITTARNGVDLHNKRTVVLLTGSTGNLGAQMLSSLLSNNSVARVYTFNRSSTRVSLLDRHKERFEDKGLDVSLLASDKLVFLEGEASQSRLGLGDDLYNEMLQNVTLIIHNAWRLDFNLALSSFEPHISGTRNLIDFARTSPHASSLRLLFTSSIAATQSWNTTTQGSYPDHINADPRFAVGGGYGESKYVTERILEKSGLRVSILRIGQISGGKPNGAWAMSDWFPMMIKSSLNLNMLPDAHGVVSWAPMDAVSDAILDVALTPEDLPLVVNLVHPSPVSWTFIMDVVRRVLISVKNLDSNALPLIPLSKWVTALEDAAQNASNTNQMSTELPAAKIIGFLQNMVQGNELVAKAGSDLTTVEAAGLSSLDTTNARRISPRMRELAPIGLVDAGMWVDYWITKGL